MSKSGNQRKEPINGKGEPPRRLVNEGAQARQIIWSLFFSLTAHTRRAKSVVSFAMCLKNKKKKDCIPKSAMALAGRRAMRLAISVLLAASIEVSRLPLAFFPLWVDERNGGGAFWRGPAATPSGNPLFSRLKSARKKKSTKGHEAARSFLSRKKSGFTATRWLVFVPLTPFFSSPLFCRLNVSVCVVGPSPRDNRHPFFVRKHTARPTRGLKKGHQRWDEMEILIGPFLFFICLRNKQKSAPRACKKVGLQPATHSVQEQETRRQE